MLNSKRENAYVIDFIRACMSPKYAFAYINGYLRFELAQVLDQGVDATISKSFEVQTNILYGTAYFIRDVYLAIFHAALNRHVRLQSNA